MHQLLAHDPLVNPAILTSKFVDGLKPKIRAAVVLHRPKGLDTASSLAILQEEILAGFSNKENKRTEHNFNVPRSYQKHPQAIAPIPQVDTKATPPKGKPDEKLAALLNYRRSKGLCFKCGGKWGPQHKCPANVPLNIIEEVWNALGDCYDDSVQWL